MTVPVFQGEGEPFNVNELPEVGSYHYEGTKEAMTWLALELMTVRRKLQESFGPIHRSFGEMTVGEGNQAFLRKWSLRIKEVLRAWEENPAVAGATQEIILVLNKYAPVCDDRQAVREKVIAHYG